MAETYSVYVGNKVGCESTTLEGLRVINYLLLNGHSVVENPREATHVVLNTCAFLPSHRKAIEERLAGLCAEAPEAQLVVMGCAGAIAPDILLASRPVLVCGHRDLGRLDELFFRLVRFEQTPDYQFQESSERVLVPIGRGCAQRCSYCSIKRSIGAIRSRPVDAIAGDFRRNVAFGKRRFLLAGDDLGSYGLDTGSSLAELLSAIDDIPGEFSVLLGNIHPTWFLEYFGAIKAFLGSPHASKWLFLPIQSADQAVLKAMRRDYPIEKVSSAIEDLRRSVPGVRFYYDIMVGYPTEDDAAFGRTLDFIVRHPASCMTIARFSSEPGTDAADLPTVDPQLIRKRAKELQATYAAAVHLDKSVKIARWGQD
ncbi:MAG: radical SAM protein [Deltaproteobacteria bacterium]|nr:radical SAM protein [Deltaproteobacteria bacterium]